jgi:hypothetical protein
MIILFQGLAKRQPFHANAIGRALRCRLYRLVDNDKQRTCAEDFFEHEKRQARAWPRAGKLFSKTV